MGEMGSTLYFGMSIVFGLMAFVALLAGLAQLRFMFSVPNERVIQINVDYRFIPLSISVALVFILGSATWFGLQKSEEQAFMEFSEAEEKGMMGTAFLMDYLAARGDDKCDHVRRPDGKPVIIAIDTSSETDVLCGVTHSLLGKKHMVPFIKIGEEYRIMIGDWPFDYSLAFNAPTSAN